MFERKLNIFPEVDRKLNIWSEVELDSFTRANNCYLTRTLKKKKKKLQVFFFCLVGDAQHVSVHELSIFPSPIEAPGKAWLSLNFTILETFNESNIKITMYKELLLGSIFVPCVFHMGSW